MPQNKGESLNRKNYQNDFQEVKRKKVCPFLTHSSIASQNGMFETISPAHIGQNVVFQQCQNNYDTYNRSKPDPQKTKMSKTMIRVGVKKFIATGMSSEVDESRLLCSFTLLT